MEERGDCGEEGIGGGGESALKSYKYFTHTRLTCLFIPLYSYKYSNDNVSLIRDTLSTRYLYVIYTISWELSAM
jgi:hypothetical protein